MKGLVAAVACFLLILAGVWDLRPFRARPPRRGAANPTDDAPGPTRPRSR